MGCEKNEIILGKIEFNHKILKIMFRNGFSIFYWGLWVGSEWLLGAWQHIHTSKMHFEIMKT